MVASLRVLLVEDDDSNIELWNDRVETHNSDREANGFSIETSSAKSVRDATLLLETHRFDAAIIDLRLHANDTPVGPNDDGNKLVKHVIENQPIGVVVYTGQKSEAADYGCPQVQVMDRGDGLDPVFIWLKDHRHLFLNLRSVREAFDRETAKLFFKSIWPRWRHWASEKNEVALKEVVARHVIAHAHDSMLHDSGGRTHPEETYFVPPLKPRLDTGDLLDLAGAIWIVVTPRCDMAHDGKISTVLLAQCQDISKKWDELIAADSKSSKSELSRLVQHDRNPKQHFLPRMSIRDDVVRGPWMVQFHDLQAYEATKAFSELSSQRFASLAPQFSPSLVERFGAYFSRMGTPDLSSD